MVIASVALVTVLSSLTVRTLAQGSCYLVGPTSVCVNQEASFGVNPAGGSNYMAYWSVNGINVGFDHSTLNYTFTSAGTYTVAYDYSYEQCALVWDPDSQSNVFQCNTYTGGCNLIVIVTASFSAPVVSLSPNTLCQPGSVTATVTNPQGGVNYTWTSSLGGQAKNGAQVTFDNINAAATFTVSASNGQCTLQRSASISYEMTDVTPVLISSSEYRKAKIGLTTWQPPYSFVPNHYWQTTATGQVLSNDNRVQSELTVTQPGTYFIRKYVGAINCWTQATGPVNVTLNYQPPILYVVPVPQFGYASSYANNDDKANLFLYADYYLVSSATGTETSRPYKDGQAFLETGTYFIRGRDKGTGTWGEAFSFYVIFKSDQLLNSIHTKTFEGMQSERVISESKSYFDQRGQALQSQTKTFHFVTQNNTTSETPFVFASQSLKDKYDRTVGGTLSAPIQQNDFLYNAAFALNDNGKPLTYADFDKAQPLATDQKGTLGNYFSVQNAWGETQVPQAKRLFSRTDFYEDGTGEERKSAQPGDTHFIGSGKEVVKGTFPVGNDPTQHELKDYLTRRADVFSGQQPSIIEGVQTVVRDENGRYAVSISDKSGKVLMTARRGGTNPIQYTISSDKMVYFYVMGTPTDGPQQVTVDLNTAYTIENTLTNTPVEKITSALPHVYNLSSGFYRILPNVGSGAVKVSYTHYFTDIAYQFYNDAGRLVSSVSPNGYEQWKGGAAYNTIDKSTHEYNHQGWLLSMTETDAGKTEYKYRKDGKIRFSQNAQQKENETSSPGKGRFSYTNYDRLGRPVESGEYIGTALTFASLTNFEFANQTTYSDAEKKDWVRTYYDLAGPATDVNGFVQNYVRGAVSWTENANNRTWYSYDEMGRVTAMVQSPKQLPLKFLTQYEYDFLGNVLTTSTRAFNINNTEQDAFYHHYEYDRNKRLIKASTSRDGVKKTVQAEYFYYLHGPLKRVVLASKLQGIDFVYNIHGWLTQINHPDDSNVNNDPGKDSPTTNGVRKDAFGMILEYYERTMTPGIFASANDPMQYHRVPSPNDMETNKTQVTLATDPITLYKESMRQSAAALQAMETSSGGGQ
jgi:hypothetical protein